MTISRHHVAALQAALAGDADSFDRMDGELGLSEGREFPALLSMAFIIAARLQFGRDWSTAEVIRFVSQARIQEGSRITISPTISEQLILSALRDTPLVVAADETTMAYNQFILMRRLASGLDSKWLSLLLAQAQDNANQWMAEQGRT
jgi:hypothetical protein